MIFDFQVADDGQWKWNYCLKVAFWQDYVLTLIAVFSYIRVVCYKLCSLSFWTGLISKTVCIFKDIKSENRLLDAQKRARLEVICDHLDLCLSIKILFFLRFICMQFAESLIQLGYYKVCVLHKGIDVLRATRLLTVPMPDLWSPLLLF